MRRNIPIIFFISVLLTLILCSACTMLPSANQSPDAARLQVSEPVEPPRISFDEARHTIPASHPDPDRVSTFIKPIFYIIGIDVDESGNARNWIFAVRRTSETEMLAYDGKNWVTIPWSAPLDLEEITVDSIISPAQLFSRNAAVIVRSPPPADPERRELELKQGIYTLTITSGSTSRVLAFNATTGELIAQS